MRSMGAKNPVAGAQGCRHADGNRFLADTQVNRSTHKTITSGFSESAFDRPDTHHADQVRP